MLALALLILGPAQGAEGARGPGNVVKPASAVPPSPDVAPLPPASFDPTLAVGGDAVKARKIDTRLGVDVFVDGRGPYHFIVDSGADTSAIGLHIANSLKLPPTTPAILNGMTSRKLVERVKVDELKLGPSIIRNLELPALREEDVGSDGIIGIDALVQQRLMMDFDKRLIRVEDARKPERYEPGEIVITARRRHGQLILTHVRAAGLSLDAVIDTGSEITIGNLALRDRLLRKNHKFVTVPVTGVTGATINLQLAQIDELQLGPITLQNVPIAFADVPPFKLFGLSDQPALLLGTDLLETFRKISLDFKARKVRFQLRRCTTEGVVVSTSPDSFTRLSATGGADVCGSREQ